MEFLIFWLGTTVASYCMEFANEARMFKDAANAGYKIDVKRLSELGKQLNPNASKTMLLLLMIPILNFGYVIKRTIQYNDIRSNVLDSLNSIGALEEMTDYEKKEYEKKPTTLNAIIIPIKSEIRLSNASTIEYEDGIVTSKIVYEKDAENGEITILQTSGPVSRLCIDEQKEKINEYWKKLLQERIDKYILDNEQIFDIVDNYDFAKIENMLQELKKEELEALKEDLLNYQEDKMANAEKIKQKKLKK